MLSTRGQANVDQLDVPWRFAKGTTYDPDTNPDGLISYGTAENALMQKELEIFANKVECLSHLPRSLLARTKTHSSKYDVVSCKYTAWKIFSPLHRSTSLATHSAMRTVLQADLVSLQRLRLISTSTFLCIRRSLATTSKYQQRRRRYITS
jgi:hypothetical protein